MGCLMVSTEATQLSSCVRTFPSNEVQQYPDGYPPLCRPVVWRHFPHIHIHLLCGVMYSNRYVKSPVGSSVPLSSNLTTDWPPTNPDREQSIQKHIRRLARLTMDPPVQQCLPITQGINSGSFPDGISPHPNYAVWLASVSPICEKLHLKNFCVPLPNSLYNVASNPLRAVNYFPSN